MCRLTADQLSRPVAGSAEFIDEHLFMHLNACPWPGRELNSGLVTA